MGLLLHRLAAALVLAFETLACIASVGVLVLLAAAPLYAGTLPFTPAPWQWAGAFLIACIVAIVAAWVRGVFDRRLPARPGGDPRHAHISGWTFVWIVIVTSAIIALATWAAKSDANRASINTEWGEGVLIGLGVAFLIAALAPPFNLAERLSGVLGFFGMLVRPFGALLSALDSLLVFAVAGASGVTQRNMLVRYALLFATLGSCAAMGYWLAPPWGLVPLGWAFLVTVAISRRWAWIETDRELAMLNRRFVGNHLRIGFDQDLRDEALLSFGSLLLLVPLALRQAQITALGADFELFNTDLAGADNVRTWIAFFGAELAKAVPFVDWAEVYDVGAADDGLVRSAASQHFVFATRILVDLVFLAALLQALSISARNATQRGLFYEGQLDRLDPFLEPREFRKLLHRGKAGALTPDPARVREFPTYDPIRLSELAGDDRRPLLRSVANALRVQQGGSNIGEFHQELDRRARAPRPDKAAILQVINAIRAAGPDRDVPLLDQLRRDLNGTPRMIEVRAGLMRLIAEAPDTPEKASALASALDGHRDSLGPVRLRALSGLGAAAARGSAEALAALEHLSAAAALTNAERRSARILLRRATDPDRRVEPLPARVAAPMQAIEDEADHDGFTNAAADNGPAPFPVRRRRRSDAPEWIALAVFTVVSSAGIYLYQHPDVREDVFTRLGLADAADTRR